MEPQSLPGQPTPPPPLPPGSPAGAQPAPQAFLEAGQAQARVLLQDIKAMDFKQEVVPIDSANFSLLTKDVIFWVVTVLGIGPLLIVTVERQQLQLTLFALFFSVIWGFLFKNLVIRDDVPWKFPVISIFFTGFVGLFLLSWVYQHLLPASYLGLSDSRNPIVSLIGYTAQVGVCEELCKILPVVILLAWKGRSVPPLTVITIGMFSGLGFAAFENMEYGHHAVRSSFSLAVSYGAGGLRAGVEGAMIMVLLRSLSLVFCHAVWAGIFAYFLSIAVATRRRIGALFVVGLCVSSVLHGAYDWFQGIQSTLAAGVAGLSVVLLFGYVTKVRGVLGDASTGEAASGEGQPAPS